LLADDPSQFADRVLQLFAYPEASAEMARRARAEVETNWDMARITARLVQSYRKLIAQKRSPAS
jgi:glycosyltransferase involved in cell wall biosynthesis